ncbi:MAG: hypothetical protein CMP49_00405 [Flavobacteriales bacterium]|nr:hypothetical protein [Flavobacteriales bacterium]|tara:strand:- start:301 stop:1311 length:1011 start_codon:yes stop_codon:yes gene_type:complete
MGCTNCNTIVKKKSGCKNSNNCSRCNKFTVFDWLNNIQSPSQKTKCKIIEVSFKNGRKKYYSNHKELNIKIGDPIVVKCDVGYDIGLISLKGELVKIQLKRKNINPDQIIEIIRHPFQGELDLWHTAIKLEKDTLLQARKIVKNLQLNMKITDVEYQADKKRAIFYYLADERVDFRELIKVINKELNVKSLLKQVGARQESAIIGGIGSCGRELCCSSWLTDTRSVSISAARYQKLSLNPQKLTGQCGKLKCCLNYELENYMEALKEFPNTKILIETKKGKASVQKIDIFKKKIWYSYIENSHDWFQLSLKNVNKMITLNKQGKKDFILENFIKTI